VELVPSTQRTLLTILAVVCLSTTLGLLLGILSSRRASVWDGVCSRLLELSGALHLLLAIPLLQTRLGTLMSTIVVLGCYQGLRLARLCRNEMRFVRRHLFVLAARGLGLSAATTQWRHVLPHAAPVLAVSVALTAPLVVCCEAALAILGLDGSASWGALIVSSSPGKLPALLAIVALTLVTHLAAERACWRLLPHTIGSTGHAPLATERDRSR
jgi:peptide/nickel transport system permease protein